MSEHPVTEDPSTAPGRRIRAVILAVEGGDLAATRRAIEKQVYGVEAITIVDPAPEVEAHQDLQVVSDFAALVGGLGPEVDLVWILHGDAEPRPDALGALVAEVERSDASLVGSKIMDAALPDRLESVGSATDVFGEPYTGLDPDEVDLEQYDVVRDVAFVSAVSMLVRRDLLRGLRGIDPLLPPVAAGMDFSQRARVAGGRVMVVPSSEVLHERLCREDVQGWTESAGRMRSMLKAYRLITLAWVVPIGTLLDLFDGVMRLLLGTTRPLFDFVRALAWNVAHLPGSLVARNSVRAVRQVGDEELFRYQVAGSVRFRSLVSDVAERFGWVIDDEPGVVTEEEMDDATTAAGPVVAAIGLIVVAIATRGFWVGALPQSGFTLPVVDPIAAIAGFAGGWNEAGLGSPEPVHPSAALFGALETITGGWGGTIAVVVLALVTAAFFGAGQLLRELGVTGPTRHLAGVVAVIGLGAEAFATDADLAGWLAIGPLLWALAGTIAKWPKGRRARVGRAGAIIVSSVLTAALSPLAAVVLFLATLVLWGLVPGVGAAAVGRGLLAADVGLLAVAPYLAATTAHEVTETGPTYAIWPGAAPALLASLAIVAGAAFLPGRRHRIAAAGGLLVAASVWVPTIEELRGDFGAAVVLAAVVGLVLVVGSAAGLDREGRRWIVAGRLGAALAAVGLVAASLPHVLDGRAGFPGDQWGERLAFTSSIGSEGHAARVLVVGSAPDLPGEVRSDDGVTYRVLDIGGPSLETARLGEPRLGDDALASLVASISGGELVRPGEALAEFGIGWVAVIDDEGFAGAMSAQVDMDEVPVAEDLIVFQNSVPAPRAVTAEGAVWASDGTDLVGPPEEGTLRIADNAASSWAPDWQQADWANAVSTHEGRARFEASPLRRSLGWVTLSILALGVAGLPFIRREPR